MNNIYDIFINSESVINAAFMFTLLIGGFFSSEGKVARKMDLVFGGMIFLSFSGLTLSVVINILHKGF